MHFVSLSRIRDYGNLNVRLAADMTISKALVVSSIGVD